MSFCNFAAGPSTMGEKKLSFSKLGVRPRLGTKYCTWCLGTVLEMLGSQSGVAPKLHVKVALAVLINS